MKKQEFIEEIKLRMEGLPEEEVNRSIDYYSEMIEDRIEDGMEEEEAVVLLVHADKEEVICVLNSN